jgi:threonine 3-dehydrogenase
MGATRAVNVGNASIENMMMELEMQEGFDVGLELSGNPLALESMLENMNHGGKVALLGFQPRDAQIDWNQVILKGLTLKGIYGREMFETWYKMGSMLQSDLNLSPVITHHYPVIQFESGFKVMNSGQSGKVILDWN